MKYKFILFSRWLLESPGRHFCQPVLTWRFGGVSGGFCSDNSVRGWVHLGK